jgi:hypothetical protein
MKPGETAMPSDWNDHRAWEQYYTFQLSQPERSQGCNGLHADNLRPLVEDLRTKGGRSAWVPGAGLSPIAFLLAHMGLEVLATDISESAVEFQRGAMNEFPHLEEKLGVSDPRGSLSAELHDMRSEFRREAFDLIINVKAISGFRAEDMQRVATVHASALRQGRWAFFDTLNVQGEGRDDLELALESGGFVVPFSAWHRSYRQALRETEIPHIFILGHPMIPAKGKYADELKRKADTAKLRKIDMEFRNRLEKERAGEQLRWGGGAKIAQIIYGTG